MTAMEGAMDMLADRPGDANEYPPRSLKRQVSVSLPDLSGIFGNGPNQGLEYVYGDATMVGHDTTAMCDSPSERQQSQGKQSSNANIFDDASLPSFEQALNSLAPQTPRTALESAFTAAGESFEAGLATFAEQDPVGDVSMSNGSTERLLESMNMDLAGVDTHLLLESLTELEDHVTPYATPYDDELVADMNLFSTKSRAKTITPGSKRSSTSFSQFNERMVSRQNGYRMLSAKAQRRPRSISFTSSSNNNVRRWGSVPNLSGRKPRRMSDPSGFSKSNVALMMLPLKARTFPASFFEEPKQKKDLYSTLLAMDGGPSENQTHEITDANVRQLFKLFDVVDTSSDLDAIILEEKKSKDEEDFAIHLPDLTLVSDTSRGSSAGTTPSPSNATAVMHVKGALNGMEPSVPPRGVLSPTEFTKQAMQAMTHHSSNKSDSNRPRIPITEPQ